GEQRGTDAAGDEELALALTAFQFGARDIHDASRSNKRATAEARAATRSAPSSRLGTPMACPESHLRFPFSGRAYTARRNDQNSSLSSSVASSPGSATRPEATSSH